MLLTLIQNLKQSTCSFLYPTFKIEEIAADIGSMFKCRLWLPLNPVINKEVEVLSEGISKLNLFLTFTFCLKSKIFKRKKWAKMDAALKMCIELDNAGKITSLLVFLNVFHIFISNSRSIG